MCTRLENDPEFMDAVPKTKSGRGLSPVRFLRKVLVVLGIFAVLFTVSRQAYDGAREDARRAQCAGNLSQIACALRNYEQAYGTLPPAFTVDASGRPLHSWRTLILPYLEQQSLYKSIDLSKSWDDPANARARETSLSLFQCPSSIASKNNTTTYLAVVGPNACFNADKPRPLAEITDSHDSTLMVIEAGVGNAVPWMAPIDADEYLVMNLGLKAKTHHPRGMNGAFVDGSVKFFKYTTPAEVRRAWISISGNDDDGMIEF